MDKAIILTHLQKYLQSEEAAGRASRFLSVLGSVTEEDISFGAQAKCFYAYMRCNSTGVGESSFGGTKHQRTVSRDYVTDEYLFVEGHTKTCEKALSLFHLKPGQKTTFHKASEVEKLAKDYGFFMQRQYFLDLNMLITSHRLNRYTVNKTKGPFTYPICPIYAATSKYSDKVVIGYIYEMNGKEHILIEPEDPKQLKKENGNSIFSPWMLLSFIFPPLILVVIFVIIVRYQNKY